MSNADDEEFLRIFNDNNLEEVLNESENKINLTVKDLQEGLADIAHVAAFLSGFMVDFFSAFEQGDLENAPRMKKEIIVLLLNIFQASDCLIELLDVECEDEEEND